MSIILKYSLRSLLGSSFYWPPPPTVLKSFSLLLFCPTDLNIIIVFVKHIMTDYTLDVKHFKSIVKQYHSNKQS